MQFTYEAKDPQGRWLKGTIEAYSQEAAVDALNSRGVAIVSLAEVRKDFLKTDIASFLERPNNRDVVVFTRQLATIIAADIPLIEGLQTIADQAEKRKFADIINDAATAIKGGSSLSRALADYPKLFSSFYVSLVRSGEVSGRLEGSLIYLADYLEKNQALNAKVRGALAYPMFILFALGAVSIIMMTTVLPKLLDIIREAGVEDIPPITKILISLTTFFNDYILLILGGLAVLGFFLRQFLKTDQGRYKLDKFKIRVPRFGAVVRNIYLARIAETLATLVRAGVPILDSLKITSDIAGNWIYRDILLEARTSVQNGGSVSSILSRFPQEFPKLVTSMLAVGEKTGKTDFMLESVYKFYNFEAERDIQNMSQLIEPILILFLGLGVGLLVAGILLPIFGLVGAA